MPACALALKMIKAQGWLECLRARHVTGIRSSLRLSTRGRENLQVCAPPIAGREHVNTHSTYLECGARPVDRREVPTTQRCGGLPHDAGGVRVDGETSRARGQRAPAWQRARPPLPAGAIPLLLRDAPL